MRRITMVLGATVAASALTAGAAGAVTYLLPDQDAGVSTATSPATAAVGDYALLSSLVTNYGPYDAPIVFTDTVPAGLSINAAAAGSGDCTSSGQTVACRISIASGASAPVNIVVTPSAAGSYSNKASVAVGQGQHDPNPGNDSASATLTAVAAASTPTCAVPALKRTPLSVAKKVLGLLHCKVGKAKQVHSRAIPKGQVIRTTPKPGTYTQDRVVALTVSSGPANGKRRGR